MGFEQAIPPVPDRQTEIEGIQRLEASWLNQPYYKYYMQESLRVPKMAFGDRLNKYYSQLYANILYSSLALLPVLFFSRRFFVQKSGVPTTYQEDYFKKFRSDQFLRTWKFTKIAIPAYVLTSIAVGLLTTDSSGIFDLYYDYTPKTTKMI